MEREKMLDEIQKMELDQIWICCINLVVNMMLIP